MKVIIAGSRHITDYRLCNTIIFHLLAQHHILIDQIEEVISGGALGVDTIGKTWAENNNIPVKPFDADWRNINAPGAIIKRNKYGLYNARAGHDRNEQMAAYGDVLILIWDSKSSGSADMKRRARAHKLLVMEYILK